MKRKGTQSFVSYLWKREKNSCDDTTILGLEFLLATDVFRGADFLGEEWMGLKTRIYRYTNTFKNK